MPPTPETCPTCNQKIRKPREISDSHRAGWARAWYNAKVNASQCVECKQPAENGKVRCAQHHARMLARCREHYAKKPKAP